MPTTKRTAPQAGDPAPEFSLPVAGGGTLRLKDLRGRKVVLYFYPKDNTSGCTKEACDFRDHHATLTRQDAVVVGISADSVASHDRFIAKYGLPFSLASDEEKSVLKAYGVWKKKSMYGRSYFGIERTTFVVDARGRIAHVFPKVSVTGHVEEVLAALEDA